MECPCIKRTTVKLKTFHRRKAPFESAKNQDLAHWVRLTWEAFKSSPALAMATVPIFSWVNFGWTSSSKNLAWSPYKSLQTMGGETVILSIFLRRADKHGPCALYGWWDVYILSCFKQTRYLRKLHSAFIPLLLSYSDKGGKFSKHLAAVTGHPAQRSFNRLSAYRSICGKYFPDNQELRELLLELSCIPWSPQLSWEVTNYSLINADLDLCIPNIHRELTCIWNLLRHLCP